MKSANSDSPGARNFRTARQPLRKTRFRHSVLFHVKRNILHSTQIIHFLLHDHTTPRCENKNLGFLAAFLRLRTPFPHLQSGRGLLHNGFAAILGRNLRLCALRQSVIAKKLQFGPYFCFQTLRTAPGWSYRRKAPRMATRNNPVYHQEQSSPDTAHLYLCSSYCRRHFKPERLDDTSSSLLVSQSS